MKSIQTPGDDEPLKAALQVWVVDNPLPPRFQDQVWKRIARAEAGSGHGFWTGLARLVEVALPRPRIAVSYLATLVVVGVAAGSLTAQVRSSHVKADLSARYVQSVAPYSTDTLQP